MRNILAIFKRETLSFFVSPVAYIVITGYIMLAGYFFFNLLGYFNMMLAQYRAMPYRMTQTPPNLNEWVVAPFYQTMMVVLVFMVPVITMRLISEEKRTGTFELLATSPLTVTEIVLGKFFSAAFVMLLMLSLSAVLPALLWVYGNPEVKPILTGFLGLALYSLAFVSIGMSISAFTENQVVAAIGSMVALLLLYVIHSPAESVGGTAGEVLNYLSPLLQAQDMVKGVVQIKSLVYFVSLSVLGIFMAQRALDAQRWR